MRVLLLSLCGLALASAVHQHSPDAAVPLLDASVYDDIVDADAAVTAADSAALETDRVIDAVGGDAFSAAPVAEPNDDADDADSDAAANDEDLAAQVALLQDELRATRDTLTAMLQDNACRKVAGLAPLPSDDADDEKPRTAKAILLRKLNSIGATAPTSAPAQDVSLKPGLSIRARAHTHAVVHAEHAPSPLYTRYSQGALGPQRLLSVPGDTHTRILLLHHCAL
jgi:hypothetical protein